MALWGSYMSVYIYICNYVCIYIYTHDAWLMWFPHSFISKYASQRVYAVEEISNGLIAWH